MMDAAKIADWFKNGDYLMRLFLILLFIGCFMMTPVNAQMSEDLSLPRQEPFEKRAFDSTFNGEWVGEAICYGPYRDGQGPGSEEQPSREQLLEDLQIMGRHWKMLRMYGSRGSTEVLPVFMATRADP